MEDVRKKEGLALEELEAQRVELLPDREELHHRRITLFSYNVALTYQGTGSIAGAVFVAD